MSKISVVTVCLNAEEYIEETMRSVLGQTWEDLEYIIIDGASTDDTLNIIHEIASEYSDRDIHITSEPDTGIYNAMNKGLAQATGEWINFMNAGDSFAAPTILNQLFAPEIRKGVAVLYGDNYLICPFGKYLNFRSDTIHFDSGCPFCHQAAFSRTKIIKRLGFDESFKFAGDYNLFLLIYKLNYCFEHKKIPVVNYRFGGIAYQNMLKQVEEVEQAWGSYGSIKYYCRKIERSIRQVIKSFLPHKVRTWHLKKSLEKTAQRIY